MKRFQITAQPFGAQPEVRAIFNVQSATLNLDETKCLRQRFQGNSADTPSTVFCLLQKDGQRRIFTAKEGFQANLFRSTFKSKRDSAAFSFPGSEQSNPYSVQKNDNRCKKYHYEKEQINFSNSFIDFLMSM